MLPVISFLKTSSLLAIIASLTAASVAHAEHHTHEDTTPATYKSAVVQPENAEGTPLGEVELMEGKSGILAKISLKNVPAGWHAIHFHEKGDCGKQDFTSAGGHAAGANHNEHFANRHGFLSGEKYHIGDMPNIWADGNGEVQVHYFLPEATLDNLLDKDGSALIIHAGADDYISQPSGNAGDRIACGIVTAKK